MSTSVNYVGDFRGELHTLTNALGTNARVIWTPKSALLADPQIVRGSRIHSITACNSNGGSGYTLYLLRGKALSTGSFTVSTTSVTRATGDFAADGWKVGDRISADGKAVVRVSAVAATTLTTSANLGDGTVTELLRVVPQVKPVALVASQGYVTASTPYSLLHPDLNSALADRPDTCIVLGPDERLLAHVGAAVAASHGVDILAEGGDY